MKKYKSTWLLFSIIIGIELVILTFMTGCGSEIPNIQPAKEIDYSNDYVSVFNGKIDGGVYAHKYFYLIDKETEVVYLCYRGTYGISMTPRLHKDGTPFIASEMDINISSVE